MPYEPKLKHGTRFPVDSPEAEAARQRVARLAEDPAEREKAAVNLALAP